MNLQAEIRPELWEAISKSYKSEIYSAAILDAIHHLSNVLRERAGIDGDGVSLVGHALSGENPRLRINKLQTETEKNEQKGLEQILRGIYQGIRNPRSHEHFQDTEATANAIVLFINHILCILGQAKEPFTIEEWSQRVFDPYFVASERYAELLISEVPPKKITDALIVIYRNKMDGDGEKLRFMFDALTKRATESQLNDFFSVVSDELKFTQDDGIVQLSLQIIPEHFWTWIEESARLRIENKLICSIKDGEYISDEEPVPGWLGTWAKDFIKFFTLKAEAVETIVEKLRGSEEEQNYVAEFFMWIFPNLLTFEDEELVEAYRNMYVRAITLAAFRASDSSLLRNKFYDYHKFPSDWQELLIKEIESSKSIDFDYYESIINFF